jgi:hypothetical protein
MTSTSIPVDILLVILDHLDQGDLAKICLLNKICCSCSQDILYRDLYYPNNLVCDTLAQSTHLARRVRSFTIRNGHPELAQALRNMTCLRSLALWSVDDFSNVLDGCTFSLDTFTCGFPYDESLLKFLQSQPSLREAHFWKYLCFPESLDVEPTCLPNLTRVTAHYTWLPHIVPSRPVSEVHAFGYPRDRSPVDFGFHTLSTVSIKKLTISYFLLFPNPERLLASIFPSLTHLRIDVFSRFLSIRKVCAHSPFILFYTDIAHVYHRKFRNLSNALQISLLRCCRSECSQLNVLVMMALLKRSISHLSRKCPIGLPIWNSLPFLITDIFSGSESAGNGSFVSKSNLPLGLHGRSPCQVTYNTYKC